MANVFLLGNGFDLHHGLPTKYENFLHTVQFLRDHYDKSIDTVGKVFGNEFFRNCDKTITYSYDLYKSAYDTTPLDSKLITALSRRAKHNYWFKYLLSTFDKDRGWIDFEKEIAKVLKAFEKMFTMERVIKEEYGSVIVNLYNLKDEALKYIIKQFDFFFTSISYDRDEINKEYIIEVPYGSGNKEIDKEKVIGNLYKSLEELSEMLKLYLTCFVDNALIQMISQNLIKKNRLFAQKGHVISFNYTDTYELVYSNGKVAHIHGKNSKDIVLGINPDNADDIETIDTSFIQFKKYYQRVVFGTDNDYQETFDYLNQIKNNYTKNNYGFDLSLYVVGHSLDITDKDILMELFNVVDNITIMYHDRSAVGSYVKNLVSIYGKEEFDRLRYVKKLEFLEL